MDKKTLCEDPKIYIVDNFLTDKECEYVIDVAKDKFKPALVAGNDKGFISQGRTGQNCWVKHNKDEKIKEIALKISRLVGYSLENAESLQVIYYGKDQEYRRHYDAWKFDQSDKSKRCLLRGGQRMVTALVYLNDEIEGGETEFPRLGIKVKAKKGRILIFHNCIKDTNIVHEFSEHTGTPVIEGEKYAFNLWFRQQPRNIDYIHTY